MPKIHLALLTSGSLSIFSSPTYSIPLSSILASDFWIKWPGFDSWLYYFLVLWPWTGNLTTDPEFPCLESRTSSTCHTGLLRSKWDDPCIYKLSGTCVRHFKYLIIILKCFSLIWKVCNEWDDINPWFTEYSFLRMNRLIWVKTNHIKPCLLWDLNIPEGIQRYYNRNT